MPALTARVIRPIRHVVLLFGLAILTSPIYAGMVLTPAGVTDGFTLSTFVDQIPNNGAVGPVGITFEPGGAVMISSYAVGKLVVFATDTDGQHYSGGTLSASSYNSGDPSGLATTGGQYYLARQGAGSVVQVDAAGNFIQNIVTGTPAATGLVADPANGHLYVSTLGNNAVWDINPVTKTDSVFVNQSADGLTIAPDGSVLYMEVGSHILGFNTATQALVFDSGLIAGGADGAALAFGVLAGNMFVNTNNGTLIEVNLTTDAQTVIGTGGSRGDLVSVDPNNGSLLLTQTDSVLRLTPAQGSFTTPEPSSLLMLGSGLLVAAGALKRKLR